MPTIAISDETHKDLVILTQLKKRKVGEFADKILKDEILNKDLQFVKKTWTSSHPKVKRIWFYGGNTASFVDEFYVTLCILLHDGTQHEIPRTLENYNEHEMLKEADSYIKNISID